MNVALIPAADLAARIRTRTERLEPSPVGPLLDRLARPMLDLRLSVTDRCNFRCVYCMPRNDVSRYPHPGVQREHLSFDELTAIASAFVNLGVTKLRLTGGEPLLRPHLHQLVEAISQLGVRDLCLTTNGSLLKAQAADLARAGLHRVTVSLDAMDERTHQRMSDSGTPLAKILSGIEQARKSGLDPVKVNMVVKRGSNEHSIVPMAHWARREGLELRFIEYMDVGITNGWRSHDVVTAAEIRDAVDQQWPLEALDTATPGQTAARFRYRDGGGAIGIVAAITQPFCGDCTRARVTAYGRFHSCLFAPNGFDLAEILRRGHDIRPAISAWWRARTDRYSELRASLPVDLPRPEMSAIGG